MFLLQLILAIVVQSPSPDLFGRINFEGLATKPTNISVEHMRVILIPEKDWDTYIQVARGNLPLDRLPAGIPVDPTLRFKVPSVASGKYRVRVGPLPYGWVLRSMTMAGKEVLDGFEIEATGPKPAELIITLSRPSTR